MSAPFTDDNHKCTFFSHTECEYFPCHDASAEGFNCLFCYCPLYALGEECGGNYSYTSKGVKNCSKCLIPHSRDSYKNIVSRFDALSKLAARRMPDGS